MEEVIEGDGVVVPCVIESWGLSDPETDGEGEKLLCNDAEGVAEIDCSWEFFVKDSLMLALAEAEKFSVRDNKVGDAVTEKDLENVAVFLVGLLCTTTELLCV
ncbi:MAG: hypothetical protein FJ267_08935 [Planctomycetes bacterium]|nr:hypothetical protein [Planctomycetota bacterium]